MMLYWYNAYYPSFCFILLIIILVVMICWKWRMILSIFSYFIIIFWWWEWYWAAVLVPIAWLIFKLILIILLYFAVISKILSWLMRNFIYFLFSSLDHRCEFFSIDLCLLSKFLFFFLCWRSLNHQWVLNSIIFAKEYLLRFMGCLPQCHIWYR